MISHLTITVTFMTNSVGESRHVGHSVIRFKTHLLLCSKFTCSSNTRIHADICQTFQILIIRIDIFVYFANREQYENKERVENKLE